MKVFQTPKFSHPSFSFFLRRSSYVHLALLATTLISGKIAFEFGRAEREKNLELIRASVQVDVVAMPTHTLNELKNLTVEKEKASEEKTEEKVAEKKEEPVPEPEAKKEEPAQKVADAEPSFEEAAKAQEKKRQDFLDKLKNMGKKKMETKPSQNAKDEGGEALKKLVLSGNKLSKGTQIYGEGNQGDLSAFQAYAARLPDLVRPHWKLPSFLMDKKLNCRIRVWLSKSGDVARASVYQSSGDAEYDQRAIESIKAAAPFPALKEELGNRAQSGDILLGFPL